MKTSEKKAIASSPFHVRGFNASLVLKNKWNRTISDRFHPQSKTRSSNQTLGEERPPADGRRPPLGLPPAAAADTGSLALGPSLPLHPTKTPPPVPAAAAAPDQDVAAGNQACKNKPAKKRFWYGSVKQGNGLV